MRNANPRELALDNGTYVLREIGPKRPLVHAHRRILATFDLPHQGGRVAQRRERGDIDPGMMSDSRQRP
jgi:hypothetical protein